jgi:hypothetical protein
MGAARPFVLLAPPVRQYAAADCSRMSGAAIISRRHDYRFTRAR